MQVSFDCNFERIEKVGEILPPPSQFFLWNASNIVWYWFISFQIIKSFQHSAKSFGSLTNSPISRSTLNVEFNIQHKIQSISAERYSGYGSYNQTIESSEMVSQPRYLALEFTGVIKSDGNTRILLNMHGFSVCPEFNLKSSKESSKQNVNWIKKGQQDHF